MQPVVNFADKTIYYSDSINCHSGIAVLPLIISYINERCQYEKTHHMDWTSWRAHFCFEHPQQSNGYDCGVFALKAAESLVFKQKPQFTQSETPQVRVEMMYELLCEELLHADHTNKPNKPLPSPDHSPFVDLTNTSISKPKLQLKSNPQRKMQTNPNSKENKTCHSCADCGKTYKHYSSLYKHRKQVHSATNPGSIKCQETGCAYNCHYLHHLRQHLTSAHHIAMEKDSVKFASVEEFQHWKSMYEKDSRSWFVKSTGHKVVGDINVTYFYCNRSGFFSSESSGMRSLKTQGTSKIDAHCTAGILLRLLEGGKVDIEVIKTHYGHAPDLGHIRIPSQDRLAIAGLIAQGVSFDKVLDKIRDNVGSHLERLHLLTKKDILNIERAFNMRGEQRHPNDAMSVQAWVEEMKAKGNDNLFCFTRHKELWRLRLVPM